MCLFVRGNTCIQRNSATVCDLFPSLWEDNGNTSSCSKQFCFGTHWCLERHVSPWCSNLRWYSPNSPSAKKRAYFGLRRFCPHGHIACKRPRGAPLFLLLHDLYWNGLTRLPLRVAADTSNPFGSGRWSIISTWSFSQMYTQSFHWEFRHSQDSSEFPYSLSFYLPWLLCKSQICSKQSNACCFQFVVSALELLISIVWIQTAAVIPHSWTKLCVLLSAEQLKWQSGLIESQIYAGLFPAGLLGFWSSRNWLFRNLSPWNDWVHMRCN